MSETANHASNAAPAVLTLGGLLAAFGMASCCALPLFLTTLGMGTAWLTGIGLYAAFHRPLFLAVALLGLLGGAITLVWQRKRLNSLTTVVTSLALLVGLVLLYYGYTYV